MGMHNLHYEKFADGTVKCIEDEIPMELPDGWAWCRLNVISAAQPNSFVDGPFGSNLKTEHYTNNREVRIIQLNNIGEFVWKNNGVKYTTFKHSETLDRCITYPEDIVIAKMMPAGRAIIVPSIEAIYVISSDCVRLRVADIVFNKYIMFAINSSVVNEQIQESVHGIGRSRTSLSKCKELLIPIPPMHEQHAICDSIEIIFSLLTTIEATKSDLASTINIAKSKILDLAIRGKLVPQNPEDEPASVLLERIRAEKEELIRQGKIKRDKKESVIFKGEDNSYYEKMGNKLTCIDSEIPYELPKGWEWSRLGTVGEWGAGGTPNRSNAKYFNGNIPWLKTGDLNDGYITNIPESITELALQETSVHINPTGAVLIAMYGATIGKLGILTFPATTNQACCACKAFQGIDNEYLFYYLLSQRDYFINRGVGGAQSNISKEKIVATLIPIPPYNEQKRIIDSIKTLIALISSIEKSLT